MPRTTNKEFDLFKQECQKWIDYFGLKQWEVCYRLLDLEGDCARCIVDQIAKLAYFDLNNKLSKLDKEDRGIEMSAFHEVIELLLTDLRIMAKSTWADNVVLEATHEIISILENTIFRDVKP